MPKGKLTPRKKKELAYERDHRVIGSGEIVRAWRQSKKVMKRDAVHSARRTAKAAITKLELQESPDEAAGRRFTTIKRRQVPREAPGIFAIMLRGPQNAGERPVPDSQEGSR